MKAALLLISFFILHLTSSGQIPQQDKKSDSVYVFKCKLVDSIPNPPYCGVIAFAVARKFEIIESNYNQMKGKRVIIIIECPEFYKEGFFVENKIYSAIVGLNNEATFSWSIMPIDYDKEKLPLFWCKEITKLKE